MKLRRKRGLNRLIATPVGAVQANGTRTSYCVVLVGQIGDARPQEFHVTWEQQKDQRETSQVLMRNKDGSDLWTIVGDRY